MRVSSINSANINNLNSQQANFVKCYQPQTLQTLEVSKSAPNVFEKLSNFIHRAKDVTVKTYEGEEVSAKLISKRGRRTKYIKRPEESLGVMQYSYSSAFIKGDNYPQEYKDKKYLFINLIYSNKQYKQVGTQLIKEAVNESYKKGCEGRVCLNATTITPELGSPVPFYFKLGFESVDKNKQNRIEEAMCSGKKIPKDCESTTMFLPATKIAEILNENTKRKIWEV